MVWKKSEPQIESHSSDALEKLVPKERGGRNIWRPPETLAVGDLVDAMDKEKSWFESFVVDINIKDGSAKVHFMGWGSKWDGTIVIPTTSTIDYCPV